MKKTTTTRYDIAEYLRTPEEIVIVREEYGEKTAALSTHCYAK